MSNYLFKRKIIFLLTILFTSFITCYSSYVINIKEFNSVKTLHEDSILYYNNLGFDHLFAGNFENAEKNLKRSLAICEEFPHNKLNLGTAYINLGIAYMEYWKFEKALVCFNKAKDIFRVEIDSFNVIFGLALSNEALIYTKTGEYAKAISTVVTAIKYIGKERNIYTNYYYSNCYNILSIALKKQKKYTESLNYYKKALELATTDNQNLIPFVYNNMAMLFEVTNDIKNAEKYYNMAIQGFIKGKKNYYLPEIYFNFANFYLMTDTMTEKSVFYISKSQVLARQMFGIKNPISSDAFRLMGTYYEKKKNFETALKYYQQSILSLYDDYNDSSIYSLPANLKVNSEIHLLKSLKNKASAFYKLYDKNKNLKDLNASLETYDLAIKLIEKIRHSYQDVDSKLYLSDNENGTYKEAISSSFRLWEVTSEEQYKHKAFTYAEKSKSAVLLSAIRDAQAKGFGGIPDSLQQKEKEVIRDIALYKEKIHEEKKLLKRDSSKIDLWENKLFVLYGNYEKLIKNFEANYSKYYSLKYDLRVLTVGEIQNKLKKDMSIVEYSIDEKNLYIFHITKSRFEIYRKSIDSTFPNSIIAMRKSITHFDPIKYNEENYKEYSKSSSFLYQVSLKPVSNLNERLIIIPDDILLLLPFEALLTDKETTEASNYRNLPFLIKDKALSYAYSSTMLFEPKEINRNAKNKLLAFAPEYGGLDSSIFRGNSRNGLRKNLSPIPGAKEEVEKIVRIVRGKFFENKDATESNFKRYAEDYTILHLAMHGVIDNENPLYSKLVFTATNDSVEDNLLNTHEVYNLNLNARLAVLSSCSSGEGILQKGEGIMSLARGFSYAGCPSLLMTLWEIEDKASVELMVTFYKYLKKGYSKDIALQKSKLDLINNNMAMFSHPFFWSSFQCIGDSSPLFSPNFKRYLIGSISLLTLIVLLTIFRKKRY